MRFRLACRIAVSSILLISASRTAAAHEAPERPLITVTGMAEVRVAPDEGILQLRAVTTDMDAALAKSRNDEHVKAALALLRERGIKPEHVQTGTLEIQRLETRALDQPPIFIGYEMTRRITVVIKDLKQADALLTDVVKTGVNHVDGFDLRNSELRRHKDEARVLAIRAAREKALALTKEIGQTIGKAYVIREDTVPYLAPTLRNTFQNTAVVHEGGGSSEGAFSAGENSITALVTVSFELQ